MTGRGNCITRDVWTLYQVLLFFQTFKQEYKDRLSNISNLVLVKFSKDTMVDPKESEVKKVMGSSTCVRYSLSLLCSGLGFIRRSKTRRHIRCTKVTSGRR